MTATLCSPPEDRDPNGSMTNRSPLPSTSSQPALWLNLLTLTAAVAVACAWLVSGLLGWDSLAERSVLLSMLLGVAAVAAVSLYKLTAHRRHAALRTIKRFSQTNFAGLGGRDQLDPLLDGALSPQWDSALRSLGGQLYDQATRLADAEQSRARAEVKAKRLEREHATIRRILDHFEEPVLAVDGYQELSYANMAAGRLFGFSPEAPENNSLESLTECGQLVDLLIETSRHRTATRRSAEVQWGGDWYRIRTNSLSEGDQSGSGAVAVLREINEQKTMQRRNAEFVSAVSHEMKTPLTGIKAYVELLADARDVLEAEAADHVHEHPRPLQTVAEPGQLLLDEALQADVVESDRVDHPARGLGHPVRRIALARLDADRLGDQAADLVQRDQSRVLLPVAARPRRQQDRIGPRDYRQGTLEQNRIIGPGHQHAV